MMSHDINAKGGRLYLQYGAILNYVYNAWTHSVFFAILEKIWRPFKRAYDDLAPVKVAAARRPRPGGVRDFAVCAHYPLHP